MREIAIAVGLLGGMVGVSLLIHAASWDFLVHAGVVTFAAGMVFGLPCAVAYHVLLYRALEPTGELSPRWIWAPMREHPKLGDEQRGRVLPWFYAGALGWLVVVVGCGLLALAAYVGPG